MHSPAGQSAILLRVALVAGDAAAAAALVPALDADHRIEVLLGASLRDARSGFAAAALYLTAARAPADAAAWLPLCAHLATPGDAHHDDTAAALVVHHRLREPPRVGAPLGGDAHTLDALLAHARAGVAVDELAAAWADHPLHPAVAAYYAGGIRALGWRPLLYLALVPPEAAGGG